MACQPILTLSTCAYFADTVWRKLIHVSARTFHIRLRRIGVSRLGYWGIKQASTDDIFWIFSMWSCDGSLSWVDREFGWDSYQDAAGVPTRRAWLSLSDGRIWRRVFWKILGANFGVEKWPVVFRAACECVGWVWSGVESVFCNRLGTPDTIGDRLKGGRRK